MKPVRITVLSSKGSPADKSLQKARAAAAKSADDLRKKTGIKLKPSEIMVVTMSPAFKAQFKRKMAESAALRSQPPQKPHPALLIKAIVQDHLAPFLKARGFRKKGRHFWRVEGDVMDVIDVQNSQFNDAWEAKFTINLGVCWIFLQRVIGGVFAVEPSPPKSCIFRHRLSPDMEKKADYWWDVRSNSDPANVASELLQLLDRTGFPWLESKRDGVAVLEHMTNRWPQHAKKFTVLLAKRISSKVPGKNQRRS